MKTQITLGNLLVLAALVSWWSPHVQLKYEPTRVMRLHDKIEEYHRDWDLMRKRQIKVRGEVTRLYFAEELTSDGYDKLIEILHSE